jgi:hypothetical protein
MKNIIPLLLGLILQSGSAQSPPSNGIAGCPIGNEQSPPTGALRATDFVDIEYTGLTGYRTRVRASGIVTWRGGQITFPLTITLRPEEARAMIERYRSREVWNLCRDYRGPLSGDVPWTVTTIQIGGQIRRIADRDNVAPQLLRDLARSVRQLVTTVPQNLPGTPVTRAFVEWIRDPTGSINVVRNMIGPDINTVDKYGWSLLMYATQEPAPVNQMKRLFAAGVKPNVQSSTGETPLMLAASSKSFTPDLIALLIDFGADVNATNNDGQTALMYMVNHLAIYPSSALGNGIARLRAAGARTDLRDNGGLSVFDYWDEIMKGTKSSTRNYQWIDDSLRAK